MDVKNLKWENVSINLSKKLFSILENNYPERIYRLYVLNNNFFTLFIWKLIKPFVPTGTVKKVYF